MEPRGSNKIWGEGAKVSKYKEVVYDKEKRFLNLQ